MTDDPENFADGKRSHKDQDKRKAKRRPAKGSKNKSRNGIVFGLPPRVDLMPQSEIRRHAVKRSIGAVAIWLAITLAVTAAVNGGAYYLMWSSQLSLDEANRSVARQQDQRSEFAGLSALIAKVDSMSGFEAYAMDTDTDWAKLWKAVKAQIPDGSTVENLTFTTAASGGDPTTATGTTVEFIGGSDVWLDPARVLAAVSGIPGYLTGNFDYIHATASSGKKYSYRVVVTVNQSYYTFAYATEAASN